MVYMSLCKFHKARVCKVHTEGVTVPCVGVCAGEYVVAEKLVTEDDEKKGLALGPLSSGSLHSMGTHDSSSSLDWALDNAAAAKVPLISCSGFIVAHRFSGTSGHDCLFL